MGIINHLLFFFPRLYLDPFYNHLSSHWSILNPLSLNPLYTHFPLHDRSFCFYGLQFGALFLNLSSWCFISPKHLSAFILLCSFFLTFSFHDHFYVHFSFPFSIYALLLIVRVPTFMLLTFSFNLNVRVMLQEVLCKLYQRIIGDGSFNPALIF